MIPRITREVDVLVVGSGLAGLRAAVEAKRFGDNVLLVDKGRRAKSFSMQGLSLDDTAQIDAIKEALKVYGGDLPSFAVVMPDLLPMDYGFDEPVII